MEYGYPIRYPIPVREFCEVSAYHSWEEEAEEVAVREFALLPLVRQRGQRVTVLTEDGSKDQGSPRQTCRCFRWSDCFFPPGFRTLQFWTFSLNKLQYWPYIVMIEDS